MTIFVAANNFETTLGATLASGATSGTLASATGAPTVATGQTWALTLMDNKVAPTVIETVYVTAISGTSITTMAREQEGTSSPASWPATTIVLCTLTSGMFDTLFQGADNGGDARGTNALNIQPGRASSTQVASGDYSETVGYGSTASANGSRAKGYTASASALYADADGYAASATASFSLARGRSATATAAYASAFGPFQNARITRTASLATPLVKREVWMVANSDAFQYTNGCVVEVTSDPISFTTPADWAATTSYDHGDIVIPTTPNGYHYVLFNYTASSVTSGGSEPTWPTTAGDSVDEFSGDAEWVCIDPDNYVINVPTGATFYVEEVGVYCDALTSLTTQPEVSFGISGALTTHLAATVTTDLTAAKTKQRYPAASISAENIGTTTLAAAITTLATATLLEGRFYWRGVLVEDW